MEFGRPLALVEELVEFEFEGRGMMIGGGASTSDL